jgi:hypothetical protein
VYSSLADDNNDHDNGDEAGNVDRWEVRVNMMGFHISNVLLISVIII